MEIQERPAHYRGPNLDPNGVRLSPRFLGRGVYALMANKVPRDNSGVVIGSRGALVIDAGINGAMVREIQDRVRQLTDKPLLYAVNTNYHGDHTFGNYAFPESVEIVAHRKTRDSMSDLDAEKRIRARNLFGNDAAIDDVTTWRKPDRVFDGEFMELDLGDRKVQLWHFGPGNTPGDTIVYVPEVKAAWTGNFLSNELIGNTMLLEGGPREYLDTLARCKNRLEIRRIVPGHGPMGGPAAFDKLIAYLWWLLREVDEALRLGLTETAAIEAITLDRRFMVSRFSPASRVNPLIENFHRLNVLSTYRALAKESVGSEPKGKVAA
ncbi:MAG TPA: MBL fold metallo-hydrolase [Silvibacterium sp.]|nr:MBL fold metallo-hydrolase [Silvibacterium sp.]